MEYTKRQLYTLYEAEKIKKQNLWSRLVVATGDIKHLTLHNKKAEELIDSIKIILGDVDNSNEAVLAVKNAILEKIDKHELPF